jgi:magnesium-transporting ATPase (P-type)
VRFENQKAKQRAMKNKKKMKEDETEINIKSWKQRELLFLILYAIAFYFILILRSLRLSRDHHSQLYTLRPGWLSKFTHRSTDVSDAQWRNFRANLPILTIVFGVFALAANGSRAFSGLKAKGMSFLWLFISFIYLTYLHGAWYVYLCFCSILTTPQSFYILCFRQHCVHPIDRVG